MMIVVVLAALVVGVWWLTRANELFYVSVRDGKVLVVRGRVPVGLLQTFAEVVKEPVVRRGGIKAWKTESGGQLACSGDIPTQETIAAAWLLRRHAPDLKVRVVNVVDLMRLCPSDRHPHGMSDVEFTDIFTAKAPVVFAFHAYPGVIHDLLHGRQAHDRFHVRGYLEEGTTTTPLAPIVSGAEIFVAAASCTGTGGDCCSGGFEHPAAATAAAAAATTVAAAVNIRK